MSGTAPVITFAVARRAKNPEFELVSPPNSPLCLMAAWNSSLVFGTLMRRTPKSSQGTMALFSWSEIRDLPHLNAVIVERSTVPSRCGPNHRPNCSTLGNDYMRHLSSRRHYCGLQCLNRPPKFHSWDKPKASSTLNIVKKPPWRDEKRWRIPSLRSGQGQERALERALACWRCTNLYPQS